MPPTQACDDEERYRCQTSPSSLRPLSFSNAPRSHKSRRSSREGELVRRGTQSLLRTCPSKRALSLLRSDRNGNRDTRNGKKVTLHPVYWVLGYVCQCGEKVAVLRAEEGRQMDLPDKVTVECLHGYLSGKREF
jgi:hypothetical protein